MPSGWLLAALLGYLLGSFPSAYALARLRGRDIFSIGSGNMGAMNAARNLGVGWGVLVLALDVAKGALAALAGLWLGGLPAALVATVAAVAGHAWPVYTRFRGGKALGCALGCALPLYPLGGLAGLALVVLLTLLMRQRPNLAAVTMAAAYPLLVLAALRLQGAPHAWPIVGSTVLIALIVIVKHLPSLRLEREDARR